MFNLSFIDDHEKMHDFYIVSKKDFLESYSYLTEAEYNATLQDVLNNAVEIICDCFDYNYKIHDNGRVVLDDGLSIDHNATLDLLGQDFPGHLEYNSIYEMLADWLAELKCGAAARKVFANEIKVIETFVLKQGGYNMKNELYDRISATLTDFENDITGPDDLYHLLVDIQNMMASGLLKEMEVNA